MPTLSILPRNAFFLSASSKIKEKAIQGKALSSPIDIPYFRRNSKYCCAYRCEKMG